MPLFRDSENAGQLFNSDGEQDVGNPLLASWGKLGRDYIYLLSDLESSQELDAFVDVTPDNLLHNIQSDILELENRAVAGVNIEEFSRSDNKRPLDPLDSSITFHVCHSPQREVEVLHDRLLAMLEEDPTLTPRDIIVMVADIDSYSPFIQAVFGSAPADRYLPYAISDRRARQSHPVLEAFISCYHCLTVVLCQRMCWRCWMCRCWRRGLTSPKKGCVIYASGSTNPAFVGA